jgi:hypothetical protein
MPGTTSPAFVVADRPEDVKLLVRFPDCSKLTPQEVVQEAAALAAQAQETVLAGVTRNVGEYFKARGVTAPPPDEEPWGPGWPD